MDRFTDAPVSAAAANEFRHYEVDISIRRMRLLLQQCSGGHDHASLTVATLRHVFLDPRTLTGMISVYRETFDRGVVFPCGVGNGDLTRTHGSSVFMDGARPADTDPAPVLRAGQLQKVTQHPQQRHIRIGFDLMGPAVDLEGVLSHGVAIDVRDCGKVRWDFLDSLILQKKSLGIAFPYRLIGSNAQQKEPEVVNMEKFFLIGVVVGLVVLSDFGQTASSPKPTLGPSAALLSSWNEISRKLIAMAEDFPEDKYDFKPTPAQRTFAEQLLHVAGSNDFYTSVARGKQPVDDESREHYKTIAAVVAYVKKSFTDGAAAIKEKGDKGMLEMVVEPEGGRTVPLQDLAYGLIEHSGEHYGQLVVYYRGAGKVPPESRPHK